jgi:single-stranded DNA-binding protein
MPKAQTAFGAPGVTAGGGAVPCPSCREGNRIPGRHHRRPASRHRTQEEPVVDNISVTLTGRIGDAPAAGVTGSGKPWASFSLAVDVPRGKGDQREYETRWVKVWCRGPLAEHAADSLVKGDRVTVRADDISASAWTADGPDREARAQLQVQAYEVAASMRFETLTTAKAARAGAAHDGQPQAGEDPWADGSQGTGTTQAREVPEVLAGVIR